MCVGEAEQEGKLWGGKRGRRGRGIEEEMEGGGKGEVEVVRRGRRSKEGRRRGGGHVV